MEEIERANDNRGGSAESSSHKRKASDHQLHTYNAFETPDSVPFSTTSEAQSLNFSLVLENDDIVRELTIENYRRAEAFAVGTNERKDHTEQRGGLEDNSSVITSGDKNLLSENLSSNKSRFDVGSMSQPHSRVEIPISYAGLDRNFDVSDSLGEDYMRANNPLRLFRPKTNILPCKTQSFVPNAFNKSIVQKLPAIYDEHEIDLASNNLQNSVDKVGSYFRLNGSRGMATGNKKVGISLREYLMLKRSNVNDGEKLYVFKQIAEFVDKSHSSGFILKNLRPSFFIILPSKQVKYMDNLIPECRTESSAKKRDENEDQLIEKRNSRKFMENISLNGESSAAKIRKISDPSFSSSNLFNTGPSSEKLVMKLKAGESLEQRSSISSVYSPWEQQEKYRTYNSHYESRSFDIESVHSKMSSYDILKLEEGWYISPEERNRGQCYYSSNVYSLGILLFELLCKFESSEARLATMSDIHERVLHPRFLREYPKEAGICLWMLHPESSLRPKMREILNSDIFNKDKDGLLTNHLSSLVDREESDTVLSDFLTSLKEQKEKQEAILKQELKILTEDIEEIERRCISKGNFSIFRSSTIDLMEKHTCDKSSIAETVTELPKSMEQKTSLTKNVDRLEHVYFSMRSKIRHTFYENQVRVDLGLLKNHDALSSADNKHTESHRGKNDSTDYVGSFFDGLCKYGRYSAFEVRGVLRTTAEFNNSTNVISSLSLDRNEDYFAAAGISKKIKIFELETFLNDNTDVHYPVIEMPNRSRLSWVCWNNYIANYLASTDYEGVVQLWDVNTGQGLIKYNEHQKRAWSVDFSQSSPTKLASGSDDCSVKIWNIHEKNSIQTIKNIANVCSVQFSSHSPHLLAFGAADHKIYLYDLRNARIPWCRLAGHERTVSYVKFADSETLVSASTDNSLKLWDLKNTNSGGLSTDACTSTMKGHSNEKNFIGLSVYDGYVVCGSESNEVYAYYKDLPMPITSHKFGHIDGHSGREVCDENGLFVSSVCWRTKSNMVLAGNSSGCIKLLQMV